MDDRLRATVELSRILGIPRDELRKQFESRFNGRKIAKGLDDEQAEAVRALPVLPPGGAFEACWVPQAVRTIRTKDTRSISLGMYVVFTIGIGFWLVYGIALDSMPMILSNIVTFLLSATILVMKLKHG